MTLLVQAPEAGRAGAEKDRAAIGGPDAIDEMIEIHRGRLHVRADPADWIDIADARAAQRGHPIGFATPALVGYLTVIGRAVVAVVGTCSRCGCLLHLDVSAHSLRCPSAGALYRPDGRVADPGGHHRPAPLPLVHARQDGSRLQALVPRGIGAP
jgi:Rieske Fe-S protein